MLRGVWRPTFPSIVSAIPWPAPETMTVLFLQSLPAEAASSPNTSWAPGPGMEQEGKEGARSPDSKVGRGRRPFLGGTCVPPHGHQATSPLTRGRICAGGVAGVLADGVFPEHEAAHFPSVSASGSGSEGGHVLGVALGQRRRDRLGGQGFVRSQGRPAASSLDGQLPGQPSGPSI